MLQGPMLPGFSLTSGSQKPRLAILAEQVGEWVLYKDVYPPIEDIREANVIPLRELSDDEIQRWSEVFKTIF